MRRSTPARIPIMTGFCVFCVSVACLVLGLAAAASDPSHRHAAHFVAHTVETGLTGGYQVVIADLNRDGRPDLIALATQLEDLLWFENPTWTRHVIASGFNRMINAAAYDVDGDAIPELAVASGFTTDAATSQGIISILSHQGDPTGRWSVKEIDRLPTSHRLRWADIDGSHKKVLVNAPLIGPKAQRPDYRDQTPLVFYRPGAWTREVVSTTQGLVHGIAIFDWNRRGRESVLTAGFSGVQLDEFANGRWQQTEITSGDPSPWPKSGASDVAPVRLGSQRLFATIEPWHGNQVVVYRMAHDAWERRVIDTEVNDAHTIIAADVDGRGRDVIIVGARAGKRSVYLYSPRDEKGLDWDKEVLDDGTMAAGACAAADLNGDKRMDIACIGSATANLKWYENVARK